MIFQQLIDQLSLGRLLWRAIGFNVVQDKSLVMLWKVRFRTLAPRIGRSARLVLKVLAIVTAMVDAKGTERDVADRAVNRFGLEERGYSCVNARIEAGCGSSLVQSLRTFANKVCFGLEMPREMMIQLLVAVLIAELANPVLVLEAIPTNKLHLHQGLVR